MSSVLGGLAVVFALGAAGFGAASLVAGACAVRLGGARLLVRGYEWWAPSERVPAAARPHMRRALIRCAVAMYCLLLASLCGAIAEART